MTRGADAKGSVMSAFGTKRWSGRNGCLRIAHRGASAHAPENTLAAFRKAADLGADMVEVDLHSSSDGVLVVIHDADLSQTTTGSGLVYTHPLDALRRLDAGDGERIPTAEEVIECCRERNLGIYFELKIGYAAVTIAEMIQRERLHDRVIVASFRPDWLADVKRYDPTIHTSVLFTSLHIDPVALARATGAEYVHPCWEYQTPSPHSLLTPEWMDPVRAAGLGIISWHEERPVEIAALKRLQLDGICSNAPELLLDDTPLPVTHGGL
jgi:glycerophosphoryl diester phosphodiesterase